MLRKIIHIDEGQCDGCGLCAQACHEGAIEYGQRQGHVSPGRTTATGWGTACPACPTGAITFEEREAPAYDHAAVLGRQGGQGRGQARCPAAVPAARARALPPGRRPPPPLEMPSSELRQWPVQLQLAARAAQPYLQAAVTCCVAADCAAYAHGAFHRDFIRGRVTLIGCPKLDEG